MSKSFIFSSESVGEGHPDKVSDTISDSVLDACLEQDPKSRVACETLVKSNCVTIAGEITTDAKFDYEKVVREAIHEIGYVNDDDVFHADHVFITNQLTAQSIGISGKESMPLRRKARKRTSREPATRGLCSGTPATRRTSSCPRRSCSPTAYSAKWLKSARPGNKPSGCVPIANPKSPSSTRTDGWSGSRKRRGIHSACRGR